MSYDLNHFISKFENTREDKWCVGYFHSNGNSCANGWCGATAIWVDKECTHLSINTTTESEALAVVFKPLANDNITDSRCYYYSDIAARINNGYDDRYQQSTPKKRILAALYDIKNMQEKETKLHVDETSKFTSLIPIVDEVADVKKKTTLELI